jgi:hypothetical protein
MLKAAMGNRISATVCLSEMAGPLAVCRLDATAEIPDWATRGDFCSITRTSDELSVVCSQGQIPADLRCEKGWRGLKVEGPLDFGLIGIMASIVGPLAEAGVSIFGIGTFDTDYILVKAEQYERAIAVLSAHGHTINRREVTGDD